MTTSRAPFADPTLIAAMCAGFILVLTACTYESARTGAETPPAEADFNAGVAAYKQGDYATALREWRPLAKQGNAGAQNNLGVMYSNGRGVPQDYAKAVEWYRKAAEQGYADAQYNLGVMYDHGRGVPQDDAEAVGWYRKAAEQGYAKAQFNLGNMYITGLGVPLDYAQAHMWYNLATSRHPPGEDRDRAVKNRDFVAKRMTPAQISEAQKLAREWRLEKTMTRRWRRIRERLLPSMTGPM